MKGFLRSLFLVGVIGITGGLLVHLAAPGFAIESGGIGGRPANPRANNSRSESIFVYELTPGSNVQDAVQIINNTNERRTILVYAADGQTASGGAFACTQKVDELRGVGSWLRLSKGEVTLEPMTSEAVNFSLTVPKTAVAGEQNGCIVIQDAQAQPVSQGNGITLSFRSAIRVAVTVPGEIKKGLSFISLTAKAKDGDILQLGATLKNNGNVSLDTQFEVAVKSVVGTKVRNAGGNFPILAGSEANFNFEVKKPFWGGIYFVQATARYNPDPQKSVGEDGELATIASQRLYIVTAPKPLALLIELTVLLGIIIGLCWWFRRRRHLARLSSHNQKYTVKKGDTLQSIAHDFKVRWQDIAKLNKLKAPYHLDAKQEIKVPSHKNTSKKD